MCCVFFHCGGTQKAFNCTIFTKCSMVYTHPPSTPTRNIRNTHNYTATFFTKARWIHLNILACTRRVNGPAVIDRRGAIWKKVQVQVWGGSLATLSQSHAGTDGFELRGGGRWAEPCLPARLTAGSLRLDNLAEPIRRRARPAPAVKHKSCCGYFWTAAGTQSDHRGLVSSSSSTTTPTDRLELFAAEPTRGSRGGTFFFFFYFHIFLSLIFLL